MFAGHGSAEKMRGPLMQERWNDELRYRSITGGSTTGSIGCLKATAKL